VTLKSSDELAPKVAEVLRQVSELLGTLLPEVVLHHIGATAIKSAFTKGDVDVLLRVEEAQLHSTVEVLKKNFAIRQPENWDPYFASFGSDDYSLPLGIQVVVRDSEADFFLLVRDHLVAHPEALLDYNRLKRESAEKSSEEYWSAKHRFLALIIAQKQEANPVWRPLSS